MTTTPTVTQLLDLLTSPSECHWHNCHLPSSISGSKYSDLVNVTGVTVIYYHPLQDQNTVFR